MQAKSSPSTVVALLKRCYEIGNIPINIPIWEQKSAKTRMKHDPDRGPDGRVRQFSLRGEVQSGQRTHYAVNGEDIFVDEDTWIVGTLQPGAIVNVRGVIRSGMGKCATKIVIGPPSH